MAKLTTAYIRKVASKDKRIESVEILPNDQVAVWLDPKFTWCVRDGNRTVNHYEIEASDYQDDVQTFLDDVAMIELADESFN
jgi:hypothetical protein